MITNFTPPFTDEEQLKQRINSYFKSCQPVQAVDDECAPIFDKNGAPVMAVAEKPLTVSGLANALAFPSRLALLEYKETAPYGKIIRTALSRIEEYAEGKLFDKGQYSGAKFFLANNFKGWSDKPDLDSADSLEKLDIVLQQLSNVMNAVEEKRDD